jgi:predicted kinase
MVRENVVMTLPTLIVVSGPAGSGKTTLAHELAQQIGCPEICRDEIKEGMVHAGAARFVAEPGDALTKRTLTVFFSTLQLLLHGGVTVVAEAAFRDQVWRPQPGIPRGPGPDPDCPVLGRSSDCAPTHG